MSDSHDDTTGQAPGASPDAEATSQGSSTPGVKTAQQKATTPPPPPPAAGKKAPAQKSAQKSTPKAPAKKAPAKKAAPATPTPEQDTAVQAAARPNAAQPAAGAGRPLTAADYATTTRGSAASTSVMPAIRDEPSASAPAAAAGSSRSARLRLKHIEPWSVTRLAFVVSVALMIVAVVAVTIFWIVLDLTGVWDQLNGSVTNVLSDDSGNFDVTDYLGLGRLVGLTLVLSAINVVVMTALATIGAHLYNLAAQLLGGVELTFGED